MDCVISRSGLASLQTPLAPFPARLCRPGLPPASRAHHRHYTQRTCQRLAPTEAAAPAAAAATGMAADGLGALREFKLTLPKGVEPAAPLVVSVAAGGGSVRLSCINECAVWGAPVHS